MTRYCQTPAPGEEEIIAKILACAGLLCVPGTVVDIGASDGTWLSNTKFLEEQHDYTRFLFDRQPQSNPAVAQVEITSANVMDVLNTYNVPRRPTVLCIDIDGNDYWVRQAITLSPALIVMEYNGSRNPLSSVSIPDTPNFIWEEDGYYGASWTALKKLNERLGYKYVCQCGLLNSFFVHENLATSEMPWNSIVPNKVTPGYTRRDEWVEV